MARLSPQEKYHEAVSQTFNRMFTHVVRAIHTEFTYDEVLELSAPPSMRETFKLTASYAQPLERGYSNLTLDAAMKLEFHFNKQVLLPNQPVWQDQDIRPELREKFDEWLAARLRVGIDYGRLQTVLTMLQEEGCNAAQQRYYLPSIKVLWQQDEYLRKLVDKQKSTPRLSTLPMLTYELRGSLLAAAETLSVHATLGSTDHDPAVLVGLQRRSLAEPRMHTDPDGLEFATL